ncbi:MAG: hypothetical protein U0871_26490 [Gemmataceae bacterium]
MRRAIPAKKRGDAADFFILALAHERLGDKKQAREWAPATGRSPGWTGTPPGPRT